MTEEYTPINIYLLVWLSLLYSKQNLWFLLWIFFSSAVFLMLLSLLLNNSFVYSNISIDWDYVTRIIQAYSIKNWPPNDLQLSPLSQWSVLHSFNFGSFYRMRKFSIIVDHLAQTNSQPASQPAIQITFPFGSLELTHTRRFDWANNVNVFCWWQITPILIEHFDWFFFFSSTNNNRLNHVDQSRRKKPFFNAIKWQTVRIEWTKTCFGPHDYSCVALNKCRWK